MTCFSFMFRRKSDSSNRETDNVLVESLKIHNAVEYSYKELQVATGHFSIDNKVGEGGFGSVYKGKLRNGIVIAVKVLSEESRQGVHEFLTELEVISAIKHENLVSLQGYCAEGEHRILVYGYCENNSLSQTLLGRGHCDIQFSWNIRVQICIGVAQGLAFLHEEVRPYIVHRDIKASNILLDKDLTAKISDFGLAKLIPINMTHVSTQVAGTAGYLAPEYALYGQLTRRADIYSFGVVLLEIICGRPNKSTSLPTSQEYLLERAWRLHEKGELMSLIDASLNGDLNAEEGRRYAKIALLCTQEAPKLRPTMSKVVKMLRGELSVEDMRITKPGLLCELMSFQVGKEKSRKGLNNNMSSSTLFSVSEKPGCSPLSSECTPSSYGGMTFNSVYDSSC